MKKYHLSKIAIGLITIAMFSLAVGIFAGRHNPHKNFEEFSRIEHDTRPKRPPEIIGQIKSLVGNTTTIAKLEQPDFEEKVNRENRREFFENLTPEERIAEMEERLNAFTGENIVVEIPAGIEITRRISPPANIEGVRKLADSQILSTENDTKISPLVLAKNDFVAIWLDAEISDKNIAEFINLILTPKNESNK